MGLSPDQQHELTVYGVMLSGTETELERAKLARKYYLKHKFRPLLNARNGDYGDNIADIMRTIVLGQAIQFGIVTAQDMIDAYKAHIDALLTGYGGAVAMMKSMDISLLVLNDLLVDGYYGARAAIDAAETVYEVRRVDLPV